MNNGQIQDGAALVNLELAADEKALSLVDGIINVVTKFGGKEANKRLDTALKTIDKNLSFSMAYNSFKIALYIENRSINTKSGISMYLNDSSVSIIHACISTGYGEQGICQNGTINAALLIEKLNTFRTDTQQAIIKTRKELENINTILTEYEERKKAIDRFVSAISYTTRKYFKIS